MKRILLLALLIPGFCLGQMDWTQVQVSSENLTENMYRLYIGNGVSVVASLGDDGVLLVDAGYKETGNKVMNELESLGQADIKYIINTHWHADHTGGNVVLGKDAYIIAHEQVYEMTSNEQELLGRTREPLPESARPNITFKSRDSLEFNGETIQLIHLAGGHTGGDIIVLFPKSKILVVGDLLFSDSFPFVDVGHGGHPVKHIENLKWIIDNVPDDVQIVGGHGRIYSMSDLIQYHKDLNMTITLIRENKEKGRSIEDMQAERILVDWESYGAWWITEDVWIEAVCNSL